MSSLPPPLLGTPDTGPTDPVDAQATEPREPYLTDGRLRAFGALLAAVGASVVAMAVFQHYDAPDAPAVPATDPVVATTVATTPTTEATTSTSAPDTSTPETGTSDTSTPETSAGA